MSINPVLAMIPSGFKSGDLYSAIPNNSDGDFDSTRMSSASRINKEGLIETMASGVPRINWDLSAEGKPPACPSLLTEDAETNLCPNSEDFTQANWTHTGIDANANVYTAPDGTFTANELTLNASGNRYAYDNVTLVSGDDAFLSCFAKAGVTGWFGLGLYDFAGPTADEAIGTFDLINGVVGSTSPSVNITPELFIEKYPNGWYKCILKINATSSGSWSARIYASVRNASGITGEIGDNAIVWGAQAEVNDYCSSYIKTGGGTTTRLADNISGAGHSIPCDEFCLPSIEGILFAEIRDHFDDISPSVRSVSLNDNSSNNFAFIGFNATSNQIWGKTQVGGATQSNLYYTPTDRTEFQKIALFFKENQVELWVNGEKRDEDLVANSFPVDTITDCDFDSPMASYEFYGHCKDLRVYDTLGLSYTDISELLTEITS
jgi:hypothetical protein